MAQVEIDNARAEAILLQEAAKSAAYVDPSWDSAIDAFWKACHAAGRRVAGTHVAVLGTAILAKCVDARVDAFALQKRLGERGYSARTLSNKVLAPKARELGIHLGVTGLEPHQNSPYTGEPRIRRDFEVRPNAQPAFNILCDLLDRLEALPDEKAARTALRAFITVCRRNGPQHSAKVSQVLNVSIEDLISRIYEFVASESDGGRRAQAVVAGLMDMVFGADRVTARRVNDPSRSGPGDVLVTAKPPDDNWERAIEVRDKPVTHEDLIALTSRAADQGVLEVAMVAVARNQTDLDSTEARLWAAERGVALTYFQDWESLVRQALHWGPIPTMQAARALPALILDRLVAVEVPVATTDAWASLFPPASPENS